MTRDEEGIPMLDARGRPRVQTFFEEGSSLTVQSDVYGTDIAQMVDEYGPAGMTRMLDATELQFGDVSDFDDFADLMRHVREAEHTFLKLPPKVRAQFDHSVEKWLDSAHDERRDAPERTQREREGDTAEVVPTPDAVVEPVAAATGGSG